MIIFQVQPNRLYPKIVSDILENTKISHENFHHSFILKRKFDTFSIDNKLNSISTYEKHHRDADFLYGVFSSINLNSQKDDFVFTLLNHPVDLIYESYAFYSLVYKAYDIYYAGDADGILENKCDLPLCILIGSNGKQISLKEFVDLVINDHEFTFKNNSLTYYLINEVIYGFSDYSHFNYIGKYSHINHLYNTLNKNFRYKIPFIDQKTERQSAYVGERYKSDILTKKFKKQIDFYKKLDKIYRYELSV